MFKNLRKKKKGFTLIELIIVIAILAILAAVAMPRLGDVTQSAKDKTDIANAKTIANAVSILQAEGKIAGDTGEEGVELNPDEDGTDVIAEKIEAYLQTVPTPSAGGNFIVIITDGVVTVTDGEDNTLFPAP